ncbi:MAG: hypothetical protein ABTQ32_38240 [Myxococcaceae bacterium]
MSLDTIARLIQSASPAERIEGLRLAIKVPDAQVVELNGLLDQLGPPADPEGAEAFWTASNLLTRRCFLGSPHPAQAHVDQLDDDAAIAVATIFLNTADGSEREAEFFDALLPVALPALGLDVLSRRLPSTVRARVFAHFVELESMEGIMGGPATMALSEEPMDVVTLANELIQQRAMAGLEELSGAEG